MSAYKPPAQTVFKWLKANLGKYALNGLTGQDSRALLAAVQIVELWGNCDEQEAVALAFGAIVRQMQEKEQELAFHAIAHPLDWGLRPVLWKQAGLPPFERVRVCAFGPGGRGADHFKKNVPVPAS